MMYDKNQLAFCRNDLRVTDNKFSGRENVGVRTLLIHPVDNTGEITGLATMRCRL
jgi:hypothetical protein